MEAIDRRPANGGGSCSLCGASLTLASTKVNGVWFCSPGCAEGHIARDPRSFNVPEPRLYARPQRYFRRRQPRELNSG